MELRQKVNSVGRNARLPRNWIARQLFAGMRASMLPPVIRVVRLLVPPVVLRCAGIRLTAGAVVTHVHVEPLDADVLFSQPVAERRQVVEQYLSRHGVIRLQRCRHYPVVDRKLQPQRTELRRTETQIQ